MAGRTQGRGWTLAMLMGIAVVLAIVLGFPLLQAFGEQNDQIAQAKSDIALYRAEIAARPRLEAELAALNRSETAGAGLLHGASTALAAADLQSRIKALVERHGGQVRSAQELPPEIANGLEKVPVQYELSLPMGSLKAVTYAIETDAAYFFIDGVDIQPENGFVQDGASQPRNLHVEWIVSGYRWVGTP